MGKTADQAGEPAATPSRYINEHNASAIEQDLFWIATLLWNGPKS
jgi:hypothetical protein